MSPSAELFISWPYFFALFSGGPYARAQLSGLATGAIVRAAFAKTRRCGSYVKEVITVKVEVGLRRGRRHFVRLEASSSDLDVSLPAAVRPTPRTNSAAPSSLCEEGLTRL